MPREEINITLDVLIAPLSAVGENDTKVDILRVAGKMVAGKMVAYAFLQLGYGEFRKCTAILQKGLGLLKKCFND